MIQLHEDFFKEIIYVVEDCNNKILKRPEGNGLKATKGYFKKKKDTRNDLKISNSDLTHIIQTIGASKVLYKN